MTVKSPDSGKWINPTHDRVHLPGKGTWDKSGKTRGALIVSFELAMPEYSGSHQGLRKSAQQAIKAFMLNASSEIVNISPVLKDAKICKAARWIDDNDDSKTR